MLYEPFQKVCYFSKKEMSDGIPIMLAGDALSYHTMNISSEENYDCKMTKLKYWLSSDEKRARVLRSFQESRLSAEMKKIATTVKSVLHLYL